MQTNKQFLRGRIFCSSIAVKRLLGRTKHSMILLLALMDAYQAFACVATNTMLLSLFFFALHQNRPYFIKQPLYICSNCYIYLFCQFAVFVARIICCFFEGLNFKASSTQEVATISYHFLLRPY